MCAKRSLFSTVFISQILLTTSLLVDGSSTRAGHNSSPSGSQSSSGIVEASRLKRAPGWGKRAPGWGKRNILRDDILDQSESALRDNNIAALEAESPFAQETDFINDKRAPGWGKRAPGWGKRAPGWGKRSCYGGACLNNLPAFNSFLPTGKTVELNNGDLDADDADLIFIKRAPGWGKRNYQLDTSNQGEESDFRTWGINKVSHNSVETNADAVAKLITKIGELSKNFKTSEESLSANKRAPGWGKRSSDLEFNYGNLQTGKRAPGWGKRAAEWGQRIYGVGVEDGSDDIQKRAPGWGKRTPGFGEGNDGFEIEEDSGDAQRLVPGLEGKRAPGWGKRSPGLGGKRAPGWGKRSYDLEKDDDSDYFHKRAPGWGKRSPGWGGKRAPGWGKRSYEFEGDDDSDTGDKRAPGWGKRAPGWGKRNFQIPSAEDSILFEKRAPGWGKRKRAFDNSKQASGSDKASARESCQELQGLPRDYIDKVFAGDFVKCGNMREANKAIRK